MVVPNPTITPESPEYSMTLLFSVTEGVVGGLINTSGGLADVYPVPDVLVPPNDTVILVTIPAVMDAVAVALNVAPNPVGLSIETSGAVI